MGHSRAFWCSDRKDVVFSTFKAAKSTRHRRGSFNFADNTASMSSWGSQSVFAGWTLSPLHRQAVLMLISVHVRYHGAAKALIPLHPAFSREENEGENSGNMWKPTTWAWLDLLQCAQGRRTCGGPSRKDSVLLMPLYIWPPKYSQPPTSLLKDKPTTMSSSSWVPWSCWRCGWVRQQHQQKQSDGGFTHVPAQTTEE